MSLLLLSDLMFAHIYILLRKFHLTSNICRNVFNDFYTVSRVLISVCNILKYKIFVYYVTLITLYQQLQPTILINTGHAVTNGNRVFLCIFKNNTTVSPSVTNWIHNTSSRVLHDESDIILYIDG